MQRMLHYLLDGTLVAIRPIEPEDKALLADGLRRLTPETAYKRFLSPKARFTDAELVYLTEVDGHDHIAYVAVCDGMLVAVGRVVRVAPDTADLAIVVGDAWQGLGLGRWLARRLADAAAAEGITRIAGTMLADNRPALRILKSVNPDFASDEFSHGVREIVTTIRPRGEPLLKRA